MKKNAHKNKTKLYGLRIRFFIVKFIFLRKMNATTSFNSTTYLWWQQQLSNLRDEFASRNLDRSALINLCDTLFESTEPMDVGRSAQKLLDSNCRLLLSHILSNTMHYERLVEVLEQLRLHSGQQGNSASWTQFLTYATFLKNRTAMHEEVSLLDQMDQLVIVPAIIKLTQLLLQLLSGAGPSKLETPKSHQTGGFTLYVGNIPPQHDRANLAELLSISTKQIAMKKTKSKETGAEYRYAFCNFDTLADAASVKKRIEDLHPSMKVRFKN